MAVWRSRGWCVASAALLFGCLVGPPSPSPPRAVAPPPPAEPAKPPSAEHQRADDLALAESCQHHGEQALRYGVVTESERSFACALEIRERLLAPGDPELLETRLDVVATLLNACKLDEARAMLELVMENAAADPRSFEYRRSAEFMSVSLEERAGDWRAAQHWVQRIVDECIEKPSWNCVGVYGAIALHARLGHAPDAASRQLPWPREEAEKVGPMRRQFAVLDIYELYRATGQTENATRVASEHQILTRSSKTPIPARGLEPPGPSCRKPRTQHETQMFLAAWNVAVETIDDCIESIPVPDREHPPTMRVSFVSRPDGTIAAAEARGIAVPPNVLECAVQAAESMRIPATGSASIHWNGFRPD